jgi:hypothetical protein
MKTADILFRLLPDVNGFPEFCSESKNASQYAVLRLKTARRDVINPRDTFQCILNITQEKW